MRSYIVPLALCMAAGSIQATALGEREQAILLSLLTLIWPNIRS
jgi:hypothetical protein